MAGVTFCTGYHFGVKDVFEVSLVYNNVVHEMPMFEPRMHPGCFKIVFLLEDGVDNVKLMLSAKLQLQGPVFIAATNAVSEKYSFPGICNLANSGIETAKNSHIFVCRGALERSE